MTRYQAIRALETHPHYKYAAQYAINPTEWTVLRQDEVNNAIFSGIVIKETLTWLITEGEEK